MRKTETGMAINGYQRFFGGYWNVLKLLLWLWLHNSVNILKKNKTELTVFHNFIYLFLAVLGLSCSLHHSLSSVQASHCGGFSCCRARALGHADFSSCRLWALEHGPNIWWKGFIDPRYVGSSWIRDQTPVSCIGRQILYCWATREAPEPYTLKEWMLWHIKHISIVLFQNKKGLPWWFSG